MKSAVLLVALACPLHAALLATIQTSQGDVVVDLQYAKAPQAVANFITLAQGTRARVNPTTGAVTSAPLYLGEKFFRVLNEATFKIAQTGSGTGTNSGGPGYTFRDEFDPALTHVPYVLSMANSGPNTNGSQIFFTGNVSIPHLDNLHTVFGLITEPASRTVIDAILAAGNDGAVITGITFPRTDAAALAFDEHAQNLPTCSGATGKLSVALGVETTWNLDRPQPPGTVLQAYRSADWQTWTQLGEIYQGTGGSGFDSITFDTASLPRAFYQIPLVFYPDALAPASLANRTLTVGLFGTETLTFHFDSTGQGGIAIYSEAPSVESPILGISYSPTPHHATWVIETSDYLPLRINGVLNSESSSHIIGTSTSEVWNPTWTALSNGSLSLTK